MVNGVDIAVGGVSGAAFGWIFDGITEVLRNAAEYTASHTNIKSTLEALKPLVEEMKEKNQTLHLPDEELKGLKEEMEKDGKRLEELSEQSVRNYFMRPFDNMELDEMDKSLQRLLGILQVQTGRDVKEVLVQVNDCKTEIVEEISALKGKTTYQLDQVASYGKETLDYTKRILDGVERIHGFSGFVPVSEKVASLVEEEALGSSLLTMGQSLDEALSKHNPHSDKFAEIKRWLLEWKRSREELKRLLEWERSREELKRERGFEPEEIFDEAWPIMAFDEVKGLRIKVEEGTELIRKCSNVVVWTDHYMTKYAKKLDDLAKFLEAFAQQRLKRTNSTMSKGSDTQNSSVYFCSSPSRRVIAH